MSGRLEPDERAHVALRAVEQADRDPVVQRERSERRRGRGGGDGLGEHEQAHERRRGRIVETAGARHEVGAVGEPVLAEQPRHDVALVAVAVQRGPEQRRALRIEREQNGATSHRAGRRKPSSYSRRTTGRAAAG